MQIANMKFDCEIANFMIQSFAHKQNQLACENASSTSINEFHLHARNRIAKSKILWFKTIVYEQMQRTFENVNETKIVKKIAKNV